MNTPEQITLRPIGFVRNEVNKAPGHGYPWKEVISEIIINETLTESLEGIEGFSHIIVLCWMHETVNVGEPPVKCYPRGIKSNPKVGVFASRSPHRPNSIGKATVALLKRERNILTVRGLDTINGTPVLDIKPYLPNYDTAPNATVPEWITRE